jgi:hypothetical protein
MKKNFVILGEPRTASTMLCSTLNKQTDICCYNEILKNGKDIPDLKIGEEIESRLVRPETNGDSLLKFLGSNKIQWRERRDKYYDQFIVATSETRSEPIFGYKIFSKHIAFFPGYYNFLKENNTRIICLSRKNLLLQYISLLTARAKPQTDSYRFATRIGNIQPGPIGVNVAYNEFVRWKKKMQKEFIQKLLTIAELNLPTVYVTYENITGNGYLQCCEDIFKHLELDFKAFKDTRRDDGSIAGHIKLNTYTIPEKILNYSEFKAAAESNDDQQTLEWLHG